MSYASFTKIVPDLLKSVPQKLIQPTGIAVIASVGIHALVGGVLLPRWSMSSEKKSPPVRNVPLLQLTPAEQSRLPQMPPSSLPSTANQLPPLSSLPYSGSSSLPPLPSKDSSLFNLPPISPLPPLGRIPSLSQSPRQQINLNKLAIRNSPSRKDLSTPKQSTSFNTQLSKTASRQPLTPPNIELPPPPNTPWPTTGRELAELPRLTPAYPPAVALNPDGTVPQQPIGPSTMPEMPLPPSTPRVLPIDSYPIPSAPNLNQSNLADNYPINPMTGKPTQTPQAAALAPNPNQGNSRDTYPINPMTGKPTQTPQAAALAPNPNQGNSRDIYPINPMTGKPTQIPPAAALAPIPSQRGVTNNSDSSDRINLAYITKLGDWSKRHQTSTQANDPKRVDISGNYPEKARTTGSPNSGIVSVAVKVDANGKIDSNTLELIGTNAPNDVFDREAEAAVRRYQFPATGKVESYAVNVHFNNNNNSSSVLKGPTQLQPPVAPPNPAALQNLPKIQPSTNAPRSTIIGTPAQNLMETLRKNLTNTPSSSTTEKKPESTTNTSRSNTTEKKPESTTNTSRSNTTDKKPESTTNTLRSNITDKKPESTTNTSRSNTTDKKPESTTNTSRSNTTDKKPESTTNMSRSNSTDTSGQNLINKLRRSLNDTPPSKTTDTPRSNTTDTTPSNPTKE